MKGTASPVVKRALWAVLLVYTVLHLGYSVARYSVFSGASSGDFNRAYQEAAEFKQGLASGKPLEGVFHPPFYYLLLLGTDALVGGRFQAILFFYFLQFLLFPAAIWFLARSAWVSPGRPTPSAYGLAAVLTVNFQPFLETLAQHKVEGIEFFLICAAIWALKKGRGILSGALILLAANLKYLPAILLAHFFMKREKRVLLGALAGGAIIAGLLWLAFGGGIARSGLLRNVSDQLFSHKYEGTVPEASVEMQTLSGTVNRWFARPAPPTVFMDYIRQGSYMPVPNPSFALNLALALKIFAGAGWLWFIRRRWKTKPAETGWMLHLLEISVTLIMTLVISQASRVHYSILLLPAFVWTGLILYQKARQFSLQERCLFGLAYALTGMLIPGGLLNLLPPHPVWGQHYSWMFLWWSLPFYGALLLGLCALRMHHRILMGENSFEK